MKASMPNHCNFLHQREHDLYLKGKRGNRFKKSRWVSGYRFKRSLRGKYNRFLQIPF